MTILLRSAWMFSTMALLFATSWSGVGGAESATAAPIFTDSEWSRAAGTASATAPAVPGVGAGAMLMLCAAVALVAGFAVLLGWLARKSGVRRLVAGRGRVLEVVETVPIGVKRAVSLVRIGDQVLVIGQGEHELTHLATLPAAGVLPPPGAEPPLAAPRPSAFQQVLTRLGAKP